MRRIIVCQIGAREHYAVARTLHRAGLLEELITDVWVSPGSSLSHMPGRGGDRLRGRYHPALADAKITHFTMATLAREATKAVAGRKSRWEARIDQNRWFQMQAVRHLRARRAFSGPNAKPIVLAYSYAAHEILAMAHDAGAMCILGQIDGGEADEALISSCWSARSEAMPDMAPCSYWAAWRDECRLADRILVNSDWSSQLLDMAGVSKAKIAIAPVVYESEVAPGLHDYPKAFDGGRPLRVLFLGALTLRKGVLEALEAARGLRHRPVRFTFVGADAEGRAGVLRQEPNLTVHGHVPRSKVADFYRDADVFLFPTHSDGFGLTQIEALASGLPVIASRNCAGIIEHRKTGMLLDQVTSAEIIRAISHCLDQPSRMTDMSAAALAAGAEFARRSATAFLEAIRESIRIEEN